MNKFDRSKKNKAMTDEGTEGHSNIGDDFSPHIPRVEFDARIVKARQLLEKYRTDAMILFSYDNKYYYGGYRESNIRYTHRWRHCLILSQEHKPVFIGEWVLNNSVRKTTLAPYGSSTSTIVRLVWSTAQSICIRFRLTRFEPLKPHSQR
jgi:Xaa-Pro aminopeptidase